MADGAAFLPPARVVVLAKDNSWTATLDKDVCQFAFASSCYEAAALLLSKPAEAIVIQLSMLSPRHLRLLEIAKQLGVEIVGFGKPYSDVTIDQLSGVRLSSPSDLPGLLVQQLRCPSRQAELFAQPPQADEEKPPLKLVPARKLQIEQSEIDLEEESPVAKPSLAGEFKPVRQDIATQSLLTPEELAALLKKDI